MKPIRYIALSSVIILLSQGVLLSHPEEGTIVGYVYDAVTGVGSPGVNLILEGTTKGASTDPNGAFKISHIQPGTYTLTASMIGYKKKELQIRGSRRKDSEDGFLS